MGYTMGMVTTSHSSPRRGPAGGRREPEKRALLRRLARVEGQVRGLAKMVEDDRYCVDVLTQLAAAHQALRHVARELLSSHMKHCVREAFTTGDAAEGERVTDELAELMFKYSK
jgi:CsoR family transcriptional regulator, copper-sensing transcriptional repressor